MIHQHVYEGTPVELSRYLAQRPNQRFRLIELVEEGEESLSTLDSPVANEDVLIMLRDIATMKAGMAPTTGEETDRLLRAARAGGMYGDDSDS